MIGFKHARAINSTLDLNGPTLSLEEGLVVQSTSATQRVIFALPNATFPSDQTSRNGNTGTLSLQWHEVGVGPLTDGKTPSGSFITGSTTDTLTLFNLSYEGDNGRQFFLQIDYINSAYGSGLTGNAFNEPFNTPIVTISVPSEPYFQSQSQMKGQSTEIGNSIKFGVLANVNDGTSSLFKFDWYLDGQLVAFTPEPGVEYAPILLPDGIRVSSTDQELYAGGTFAGRQSLLTISNDKEGDRVIHCIAKHPNGNIQSIDARFQTVITRAVVAYEQYGFDFGIHDSEERDLRSYGPIVFRRDPVARLRNVCIYAPERDVDVKITMGGAKGTDTNSSFRTGENTFGTRTTFGGEGGVSVFKLTLKKNEEYQIRFSTGGETGPVNLVTNEGFTVFGIGIGPDDGHGGGSAAIYHKASLLAVCGGGGGAGTFFDGGNGGGINVGGSNGQGRRGGGEGASVSPNLAILPTSLSPIEGFWEEPGRISRCTVGEFYSLEFSPCQDVGTVPYRDHLGNIYTGSANILRGYKSGPNGRRNGQWTFEYVGAGGGGVIGGGASDRMGDGGGGGSGYGSGNITLLSSSTLPSGTQLGGNPDVHFITIEEYDPNDDQKPNIPLATFGARPYFSTFLKYTFIVTRSSSPTFNTVTYTRQSGTGPDQITFGPTAGTNTSQVELGAVYERTGTTSRREPAFEGDLRFRVVDGALQVSEDGVDFTLLTVSLDSGSFSGSDPQKFNGDEGQTLIFS